MKNVISQGSEVAEVLKHTPDYLLDLSVDSVNFPSRFVDKLRQKKINTLADLARTPLNVEKNLGNRTLHVASQELRRFVDKKMHQTPLTTLRDMMKDFIGDLLAREARIFEMRMGYYGERYTLDAVGKKFNLTRERVRQIEEILLNQFDKRYPGMEMIRAYARNGMLLSVLVTAVEPLMTMSDALLVVGILESFQPKLHLVVSEGTEPIISIFSQTDFDNGLVRAMSVIEDIFRSSSVLISKEGLALAVSCHDMDQTFILASLNKVRKEGTWIEDKLFSPNKKPSNYAIGRLQASAEPLHIKQLADELHEVLPDAPTPEALRASLSLIPSVKWLGGGMVGLPKHVPEAHTFGTYKGRLT